MGGDKEKQKRRKERGKKKKRSHGKKKHSHSTDDVSSPARAVSTPDQDGRSTPTRSPASLPLAPRKETPPSKPRPSPEVAKKKKRKRSSTTESTSSPRKKKQKLSNSSTISAPLAKASPKPQEPAKKKKTKTKRKKSHDDAVQEEDAHKKQKKKRRRSKDSPSTPTREKQADAPSTEEGSTMGTLARLLQSCPTTPESAKAKAKKKLKARKKAARLKKKKTQLSSLQLAEESEEEGDDVNENLMEESDEEDSDDREFIDDGDVLEVYSSSEEERILPGRRRQREEKLASFVKQEPLGSPVTSPVASTSLGMWQASPSTSDTEDENINDLPHSKQVKNIPLSRSASEEPLVLFSDDEEDSSPRGEETNSPPSSPAPPPPKSSRVKEKPAAPPPTPTNTNPPNKALFRKKGKFTSAEDEALLAAIDSYVLAKGLSLENGRERILSRQRDPEWRGCWEVIGESLPEREPSSLYFRARRILKNVKRSHWTEEELLRLFELVELYGPKWKQIGEELNRLDTSVRDRYRLAVDSADLVRGKFSEEEMDTLATLVEQHTVDGTVQWKTVAKNMPNRNWMQCYQHWRKSRREVSELGPNLPTNDSKLLTRVLASGAQRHQDLDWSEVASGMPGWDSNRCLSRYETLCRSLLDSFPDDIPKKTKTLHEIVSTIQSELEENAKSSQVIRNEKNYAMEYARKLRKAAPERDGGSLARNIRGQIPITRIIVDSSDSE